MVRERRNRWCLVVARHRETTIGCHYTHTGEQHSHDFVHFMSLWSNRLKKYDEVKKLFLFLRKSSLSTSHIFFSVSYGFTSSSLPLSLIFIWTISTAYMYLRDAAYYIYTLFWESDFSLNIKGKPFPSIHMQSSWQVRTHEGTPKTPAGGDWKGAGWWGETCSLGWKWEKLGKKQSIFFLKPYDCHQCCKKRSNTQF